MEEEEQLKRDNIVLFLWNCTRILWDTLSQGARSILSSSSFLPDGGMSDKATQGKVWNQGWRFLSTPAGDSSRDWQLSEYAMMKTSRQWESFFKAGFPNSWGNSTSTLFSILLPNPCKRKKKTKKHLILYYSDWWSKLAGKIISVNSLCIKQIPFFSVDRNGNINDKRRMFICSQVIQQNLKPPPVHVNTEAVP